MKQAEFIAALESALSGYQPLRALFLAGSLGYGGSDEHSDIDFLAVVRSGAAQDLAPIWRNAIVQLEPIVFWNVRQAGGLLINAITKSWTRSDLFLVSEEDLVKRAQDSVRPLIDRDNVWDRLLPTTPNSRPNPDRVASLVREFIRVIGLLPIVVKREEYATAVGGVSHLRNNLIALLLEEVELPHKGGALHLNRILSADTKSLLQDLPGVEATRESVITLTWRMPGHFYLARAHCHLR